jgi:hypothetical protein
MAREIMKDIKELIAEGYSGREIMAMGYAESTVRKVGDMMALRGELPGITEAIRQELMRADNAEAIREIRRELRERGFKQGSIDAVASKLRRSGNLVFGQVQAIPLSRETEKIEYNRSVAQLWEEYREKKDKLLREYNEKVTQLLRQYEEKAAQKKRNTKDEVKRLQAEVEARDRLLKKLMKRINQPIDGADEKEAKP